MCAFSLPQAHHQQTPLAVISSLVRLASQPRLSPHLRLTAPDGGFSSPDMASSLNSEPTERIQPRCSEPRGPLGRRIIAVRRTARAVDIAFCSFVHYPRSPSPPAQSCARHGCEAASGRVVRCSSAQAMPVRSPSLLILIIATEQGKVYFVFVLRNS